MARRLTKGIVFFLLLGVLPGSPQAYTNDAKTVSLSLKQVSLAHALNELASQAAIDLVYSDAVVDSLLIDCEIVAKPVEKALKELLRKTSISYKKKGRNEFVLFLENERLTLDIAGEVFDAETGEKLPYANITLVGTSRGTSSNLHGRFVLPGVPFQTCRLRVQYIGYTGQDVTLEPSALVTPLNIGLQQRTLLTEAVTVHPADWEMLDLADAPGQVSIATDNFSLLPIAGDKDIFKSLQLLPGVSSSNGESLHLFVRGGTPSQNLVLFDGMTLYHLDHSFGFLSAFNTDAIKDVRIYKGGLPAKYGGRLSSVMEITAKSGDFSKAHVRIGATPLNADAVVQVPFGGNGALLLSARQSYSNYILDDLYDKNFAAFSNTIPRRQPPNGNRPPEAALLSSDTEISFYDLLGKATLAVSPKDNFSLSLFRSQDDLSRFEARPANRSRMPQSRLSDDFVREEKAAWGNRGLSIKWFRQWQERFQSSALVAYSRFTSDDSFFENSPEFAPDPRFSGQGPRPGASHADSAVYELTSHNRIEDLTIRLDNMWMMSARHTSEFGVSVARSKIRYTSDGFDVIEGLQEENQAAEISAYLQDSWRTGPFLSITGGLRATHYDLTATSYLEPRLSSNLQLSPMFALKGSWGKNHQFVRRMPGFFQYTDGRDFWVLASEGAIPPGASEEWVSGAKLEGRDLLLDVEFYRAHQQHLTEGIPAVQYLEASDRSRIYRNSSGLSRGVDLLLQKKTGRFSGWLSYSYNKTNVTANVRRVVQQFPANHDIRHKLNLVGSLIFNGWNFSTTWTYGSGAPFTRPEVESHDSDAFGPLLRLVAPAELNAERLPATHRLDISLTRGFVTKHIYGNIGFSIYNLYNRANVWYRSFVLREGQLLAEDVTTLGLTPTLSVDLRLR